MGTNFYMVFEDNGHVFRQFHLGKRSSGWKFLWKGFIKGASKEDLIDALTVLSKIEGFAVHDEYGKRRSIEEFLEMTIAWDKAPRNIHGHDDGDVDFGEFC